MDLLIEIEAIAVLVLNDEVFARDGVAGSLIGFGGPGLILELTLTIVVKWCSLLIPERMLNSAGECGELCWQNLVIWLR